MSKSLAQGHAGGGLWLNSFFLLFFALLWDDQFSEAQAHVVILDDRDDWTTLTPALTSHLPGKTPYRGHSAALWQLPWRWAGSVGRVAVGRHWQRLSDRWGGSTQSDKGLIATRTLSFWFCWAGSGPGGGEPCSDSLRLWHWWLIANHMPILPQMGGKEEGDRLDRSWKYHLAEMPSWKVLMVLQVKVEWKWNDSVTTQGLKTHFYITWCRLIE